MSKNLSTDMSVQIKFHCKGSYIFKNAPKKFKTCKKNVMLLSKLIVSNVNMSSELECGFSNHFEAIDLGVQNQSR